MLNIAFDKFQDQAKFVSVLLPTVNYIKTNDNKFSLSVNINATQWQNKDGVKKFISHFSDQAYFLIDSKSKRENGNINLNPFVIDNDNLLDLNLVYKNSLFYNRGLQKYSFAYSYINSHKKSIFVTANYHNAAHLGLGLAVATTLAHQFPPLQ